jgi:hypothetical protein
MLALSLVVGIAAGWAAEILGKRPAGATGGPREAPERARFSLHPRILSGAILLLLAGQIALAYQPQAWYQGELAPGDPPERYLAFIRATPGEILADDVGLLYAAGRPLRYDDPSTMGPAAQSRVWDQSGLIDEIAGRRFSAILLPVNVERTTRDASGRWTPEVLAAIREHYQLQFRDTIYIYTPKN